jgi:murein DD-endopeptidase MepM/ murein hydrolase activator NlpD
MKSGGRSPARGAVAALLLSAAACAPVYSNGAAAGPPALPRSSPGGGSGEDRAPGLSAVLGSLVWPLAMNRATVLSSAYGPRAHPRYGAERFHAGLDLSAEEGTPVYAVGAGRVLRSSTDGAYGNHVVIDHGAGLLSLYAHHVRNLVREGEEVRRGQVIALVGHTGNATGDHVHFELRWKGGTVDPWTVLPRLTTVTGR